MGYYALFYYVVGNFVARRAEYREEHLRLVREAYRRGELLLAGAFVDPVDRALLVFRAADRSVAEDFARNDPYVIRGLVTRWEVRSWNVVIGNEPSDPSPRGDVR
jgi:uncharacterized protein YciI